MNSRVSWVLASALLCAAHVSTASAFTITGGSSPAWTDVISIAQTPTGVTALDLSGDFETDFYLVNSNGTLSYSSYATITVLGPGSQTLFSAPITDSGNLPVGVNTTASHDTAYNFLISLTPAEQALFEGAGTTALTVELTGQPVCGETFSPTTPCTSGPTSSTALYNWQFTDGNLSAVPLPAAAWLLLSGLGGLGLCARRRQLAA